MFLAIDVGNTNIKAGLFDGPRLCAQWRIATVRTRLADEYGVLLLSLFEAAGYEPSQVTGCAIASVVPVLTPQFRAMAEGFFRLEPLVVGPGMDHGIRIAGRPADQLGADRIANDVAALTDHGAPVIVVALGTATAIDVVAAGGDYLGGLIAPGLGVTADALVGAAAMLHQVPLVAPPRVLSLNTAEQLQGGIILGFAAMIEGLVARLRREVPGTPLVVATGGHAETLAQCTPAIDRVAPDLTLRGLWLLHDRLGRMRARADVAGVVG